MTIERSKELLPIIKAFAEGKTIEYNSYDGLGWKEIECTISWIDNFDYRIKPDPKYVPFENAKEMYEAISKHGAWVHLRFEDSNDYYAIHTIYKDGVLIGDDNADNEREFYEMVKDFVWADDGTPVGKLSNAENLAD